MSLLDNLALSYEIHVNDPIEVGIHYGKSILQALSGVEQGVDIDDAGSRYIRRQTMVTPRTIRRTSPTQLDRGRYATYVPRSLAMESV